MVHKENKHIEDPWLVGTKREQNMMNSEHEQKTKKKQKSQFWRSQTKIDNESEVQLKKLSDAMDKKILQKRKLEEERESNWEKEKAKGEILKKEKEKKIK